ncbi:MAG: tetratricopeptide repeat protein [Deltaproteobacteria bacterium]|nr:tetratricopeptide repeat protein [Deltaproteobacteria bacterium]
MAESIQGLVEVSREEAVLLLEAGYLYMDMRNFKAAQKVFNGAAALFPKSEVPQLALGTLEFAQGHHEKALQAFRAAQRVAPKAGLPRAHCGEALLFLGKKAEAEKELKAALDLDPDGDGGKLAQALLDAVEAGALPPPKKAKAKK